MSIPCKIFSSICAAVWSALMSKGKKNANKNNNNKLDRSPTRGTESGWQVCVPQVLGMLQVCIVWVLNMLQVCIDQVLDVLYNTYLWHAVSRNIWFYGSIMQTDIDSGCLTPIMQLKFMHITLLVAC